MPSQHLARHSILLIMNSFPSHHTDKPVRYPMNDVVGILDASEQVGPAVAELTAGGFMESEVQVQCGEARAKALDVKTGRRGLAHIAIRIAERLGVENIEMERKERYEQAMREGHYVILVATATEERKDRAAEILAKHNAHTVSFYARFTIEDIVPPARHE